MDKDLPLRTLIYKFTARVILQPNIRRVLMLNSITYTPCLCFQRFTHTHKTLIFQGPWFGFWAYHHGNLALTLNMLDGQQNSLENHGAVSIDFKLVQKTSLLHYEFALKSTGELSHNER